ncbi:helix-turn-helix transcriptional regulator [Altericroceibacterium endophyticum]|uniref:HTH luxR-type domain-containing protein n=1 Tax=Altericroceibacterium endophyticum TaxID=1808508 RepID=A0A6I4TAZ6_9SPHN|nr:helix-turn-helix transcriptional regulator [Altericroceibacterium endophyticum]MXO67163.1 hypothetical protein [Altericroceibacterium endophyticum]
MTAFVSDILLDLYACPAEPQRWPALLDRLCHNLGARSAAFQMFRNKNGVLDQIWAVRDSYSLEHAAQHDALVNNSANPRLDLNQAGGLEPHRILQDGDYIPRDNQRFVALRDRLRKIGLGESITLGLMGAGGHPFALILHRAYGDGRAFTREDHKLLLELAPHFDRAMQLAGTLERNRQDSEQSDQILDALNLPLLVCDGMRRIEWANDAARQIMDQSPHFLRSLGEKLLLQDRAEADRLDQLLRVSGNDGDPERANIRTIALGHGSAEEMHIMVRPLGEGQPDGQLRHLLLLKEPRRCPVIDPQFIAPLFGLTQAESRVASSLCSGHTLREYALQRGIAEGSARNQLKQALFKTGSPRQADLVRQICQSVLTQLTPPTRSAGPVRPAPGRKPH